MTPETLRSPVAAPMGRVTTALVAVASMACFHVAFLEPRHRWLIVGFLAGLFNLRHLATSRQAFYLSLTIGAACYTPHLGFLGTIFGAAAIPLWLILPFWLGIFSLILWHAERRFGPAWCAWLAPVVWTGLEYFRSEVWWLRFSWLSVGSAVLPREPDFMGRLGVFGMGVLLMLMAGFLVRGIEILRLHLRDRARTRAMGFWARIAILVPWKALSWVALLGIADASKRSAELRSRSLDEVPPVVRVAGLQLEFPSDTEVINGLNRIRTNHPSAQLIVLPEYTFEGPPPDPIRDWCRRYSRWVIVGGKEFLDPNGPTPAPGMHTLQAPVEDVAAAAPPRFRNTAFVIGTNGAIVFKQAKAQPIQFFNDGLPAESQRVWGSPWGPVGIAICYDASYRRVTDELVRQGARALIFPTMDVEEWGPNEHRLNALQARLRAVELHLPVFRVASSGPSQLVSAGGWEESSTGIPDSGAILTGPMELRAVGPAVPPDHWIAPACSITTGLIVAWLCVLQRRSRSTTPILIHSR